MANHPDWRTVEPEMVDFVFYQAERYLEAQLQSGIASDSRAITAASILVGVATAAFSGAVALLLAGQPAASYLAATVLGVGLSVAAYLCVLAAKPIDFYPPGNHPAQWYGCVDAALGDAKGAEAENYQEMIVANNAALETSATWLNRGITTAIVSPVAAMLLFLVVTSFSSWAASSPVFSYREPATEPTRQRS